MAQANLLPSGSGWFSRLFHRSGVGMDPARGRHADSDARADSGLASRRADRLRAPDDDAMRQRKVRHAVRTTLAGMGLGESQCELAIKPTRPTSADQARQTSTYFVLIRLNRWKPEVMLKSKFVERHVQSAAARLGGVRVTHVFWRFGSDVGTPYDDFAGQPVVSPAAKPQRFGPLEGLPADMDDETAPARLTEPGALIDAGELRARTAPSRSMAGASMGPAQKAQATPTASRPAKLVAKISLGAPANIDGLEVSEHDVDPDAPTVTGELDPVTVVEQPANSDATAWASLDLNDSTPPRTWAETMPCELPASGAPSKAGSTGFVRL